MGKKAAHVALTPRQRAVIEPLARSRTASQRLVERARIVLMSAEGRKNEEQAADLGVDRQRVRRWRSRWAKASKTLVAAEHEGAKDRDLEELILRVLTDNERSGAPARFTPEQVAAIISLACESPSKSGLAVSHWTPPELAREAIKRGIVATISPRHVDRFLARRTSGHTRASTG